MLDLLRMNVRPSLQGLALVFDDEVQASIMAAQDDSARHQLRPTPTADGRWFLCADCLSESDGLFCEVFTQIIYSIASQMTCLPMSEIKVITTNFD